MDIKNMLDNIKNNQLKATQITSSFQKRSGYY